MPKKMYVIQADGGMFYCGMRYWDKQLRKAKIYHSLAYAEDVSKAYEECNCKIREVSLAIVPETKTNADRIRSMPIEELADYLIQDRDDWGDYWAPNCEYYDTYEEAKEATIKWLQAPAEGE